MAVESNDPADLVLACKQIIENCCLDKLDVGKLTTFDMEYIFLKLKAQSVNNISKLTFEDVEDKKRYNFEVDLDAIEIELPEDSLKKIKAGNATIVMKYPTMDTTASIMSSEDETTALDRLVVGCVDYIYDEDTIYKDFTEEEITQWIDAQPPEVYSKMRVFFDSIPKLSHTINYTNSKGSERKIVLTSLSDFFPW